MSVTFLDNERLGAGEVEKDLSYISGVFDTGNISRMNVQLIAL